MCGIAGMVGNVGDIVDAADVRRMCQTIVHRGPDDEGIYASGPAGLGMRRLSIIDLSGDGSRFITKTKVCGSSSTEKFTIFLSFAKSSRAAVTASIPILTPKSSFTYMRKWVQTACRNCAECLPLPCGMSASSFCCWRATAWARSLCTMLFTKAGCYSDRRLKLCWQCIRIWPRLIPKACCNIFTSDIFLIRTPPFSAFISCPPGT